MAKQPRLRQRQVQHFRYGMIVGPDGSVIKKIVKGTVAVDPASIPTVSTGKIAVTITGVAVGDIVHFERPDALNDDLIFGGARVTGANTVTIYLYNPTAGAIDDVSLTWNYTWIQLG